MTHQNPLDKVLERLDNPRKYGNSWRSRCPAHNGKNPTSLKIDVGRDGKPLLCCHSEHCSEPEILHSIGLESSDLFERPNEAHMSPEDRRRYREQAKRSQWKAALETLPLEIAVAEVVLNDCAKYLDPEDVARAKLACKRLRSAREVLCDR